MNATASGGGSGPSETITDIATLGGVGGDDLLEGGEGDDHLDGGGGSDTASYASASGGVTVDLFWQAAFGAAGNDSMVSIENAIGSDHDDALIGDGGDNRLSGNAGHDHLFGAAGNDSLLGGTGDDYLIGGAGDDLLDGGDGLDRAGYSSGATAGVTVNLNLQGVAQNTGRGLDVLIGIEHVSGTRFDDVITGDGGDNWLWGGSDGSGVTGNDIISAGAGNDLVDVGTGNHVLNGGVGIDTLSLDGNGTDITAAGVTLSLLLQGAAQDSEQGMMNLSGFENLSGSLFDDHLTGDGGNNVLAGYAGADTLVGGAGNDVLLGDGIITVDTHDTGRSGPIFTIEDVGADASDVLDGCSGNDRLMGGGGGDQLRGGTGADHFVFLSINDSLTGASDLVLDYSGRIAMTTNSRGRPIRGTGEGDKIDLSAIDANINLDGDQSFTLVELGFSGVAGEMFASYDSTSGRTSLYLDVDGDAVADMTIDFAGQTLLTGSDFIF